MPAKRFMYLLAISLLLLATLPIATIAETTEEEGKYSTKDEVIYANLQANGKLKNMYIVNRFDVTKPGVIIDYGNYVDLRNLTNLEEINQIGPDQVQFEAEEGKFFYQGELEGSALPWDILITYLLDGKEVDPAALPGKTGKLAIQIETKANEKVHPLFFEHFLLQITLTLDPEVFDHIQAPKGTEANEGKNKQINFTVLPEQEDTFIVSANVTELEMDPIMIAAVPANIAIEDPDLSEMTGGIGTLAKAIKDVHQGVNDLNDGARELQEGATELEKGSRAYQAGINELDQSSASLVNGSKQIRDVLRQVGKGLEEIPDVEMPDLTDLKEIPAILKELSKDFRDFGRIFKELDEALAELPSGIEDEELEALYDLLLENDLDDEVLQKLEQAYDVAQDIKGISEGLPKDMTNVMIRMGDQIDSLAVLIEEGLASIDLLDELEDLEAFQEGLMTLASEYETFHNGLVSYTSGVHKLSKSYHGIDDGIVALGSGMKALSHGVSELLAGTNVLQKETSSLPDEMQSKIDEFMAEYDFSSFEPVSFVAKQNESIDVVQFVLQTERLKIEETQEETKEETIKKGLWERFLDLFR